MPFLAPLRTRIIQLADFTEAYLLSAVFLCMAYFSVDEIVHKLAVWPADPFAKGWLVDRIRELDLLVVTVVIGLLLLFRHPAKEGPRNLKEVLVPLAVTFFFLAYRLPPLLPAELQQSLAPPAVQRFCAIASLFFNAAGAAVVTWGVVSLGRSFGVFVAVRKIVLAGPYRYVRHPIYSGYVLMWIGIILANLSIAIMCLVAIHTVLMVYRARLEERRLAEASPEYRAHLEQTGFLFPRFGQRRPDV
jgi:protein-S-isoprenylcysteine O-methyltransferase Ste14